MKLPDILEEVIRVVSTTGESVILRRPTQPFEVCVVRDRRHYWGIRLLGRRVTKVSGDEGSWSAFKGFGPDSVMAHDWDWMPFKEPGPDLGLTDDQLAAAEGMFQRLNNRELAVATDVFVLFGILLGEVKRLRRESAAYAMRDGDA